jgi:uncharacterized membrane protein YfcA
MLDNLLLFIFTVAAFFVKGITGFGNTLVMGSLFSFILPNRIITPVDLIISIPTNMYLVWRERKNISFKIIGPLSVVILAGIIPGAFLLKVGSDWILKSLLGLVVIGMAGEMLVRKPQDHDQKKSGLVLFMTIGLISGLLCGLYGISALLVTLLSRNTENRSQFRGNICSLFLVDNLFRFVLYWYTGILTKQAMLLTIGLSPAVILGMYLGIKGDAYITEETGKKFVIFLLISTGAVLFVKSLIYR